MYFLMQAGIDFSIIESSVRAWLPIVATFFSVIFVYLALRFNRRKDFQDNLYRLKLEVYRELADKCLQACQALDINSAPFNQIYDIEPGEEWEAHFTQEIAKQYSVGFELEAMVRKHALFLPSGILDSLYSFSQASLSFVTQAYHHEPSLLIDLQDILSDSYFDLIMAMRDDLRIDSIEKSLLARLKRKV